MINIVYFHGFGSSSKTNKVQALRAALDAPVFAYDASIDPEVAIKEVGFSIDMLLMEDLHVPIETLFVGTSLGGWLASELGAKYGIPAIVINPSFEPSLSLRKYGISEDICNKYTPIKLSKKNVYFFAENDAVIDNTVFKQKIISQGYSVFTSSTADHRFHGDSFNIIINYIKEAYNLV